MDAKVDELLSAADPEQRRMMEERCVAVSRGVSLRGSIAVRGFRRVILLDFDDNVIGHESKTICE